MFDEFLERINSLFLFVAKFSDRCFCWCAAAMLVCIQMDTNMASTYCKALKQKNDFPK